MFDPTDETRFSSGVDWARLEPIVTRFEADFRRRPWPRIEDYLPEGRAADRAPLLLELVHADMELRRRVGEPASAREYLERFPELAGDAAAVAELLAREAELDHREHRHEPRRSLGRFELLEIVGEGTFGLVYRAQDTELDRIVAVKIPRPERLESDREVLRFLREARHGARLRHSGLVSVHEVGRIDGTCFLVSDFIEGLTLAERRARGPIAPRDAAQIIARVAETLAYVHGQGIVHRDLKPSNILLDTAGTPLLTDFGLASRLQAGATLSTDGRIRGTPAYLSPEQAVGDGGQVEVRSDIYSLGVVLYELLTGGVPFRGSLRMVLIQILEEDPWPPRRYDESIPRDLETICLKAMAKEPARRYATAEALATDLRRFLDGRPVLARPLGRFARSMLWCRRRPRLAAMTVAAALAVAGMAWQWWRAEVNLATARRESRRFAHALENCNRVTSLIIRMLLRPDEPGSIDERAQLEQALDQMNRHIGLIRGDPQSGRPLMLASIHQSELLIRAGRRDSAHDAMRQAAAVADANLSRHPDDPAFLCDLASVCCRLARTFRPELGRDEAGRWMRRAEELYRTAGIRIRSNRHEARSPQRPGTSRFFDTMRLGTLAARLERRDDAIAWLSESAAIFDRAYPRRDAVTPYLRQSYLALQAQLGRLLGQAGRPAEAFPHLLAWHELRAEDYCKDPRNPVARKRLAAVGFQIGLARRDAGQPTEALREFEQVRALREGSKSPPSRNEWRDLARTHIEIGRLEDRGGLPAQAIRSFAQARVIYQELLRKDPADKKDRRGLATCDHVIGNLHCDLGQYQEAAASFRLALELRGVLAREAPDDAQLDSDLNGTRHRLAEVQEFLPRGSNLPPEDRCARDGTISESRSRMLKND